MPSLSARALSVQIGAWRAGTTPAYVALADRIRLLVLDGRIALGTRLPAERELASYLQLSRTTVSAAYAELRDSGYVDSVRGSGSVVRMPSATGFGPEPSAEDGLLDFTKASLPAVPAVADAAVRAAALLPSFLGEPGFDAIGQRALRQALADRYAARGLPTDPDEIMVTNGAQHAISLIARTLLSRGDRALVESPSYPHAAEALKAAGARLVTVPVTTDDGWDEPALEQLLQRTSPTLAYLMPDFQNPTGRSMPDGQRAKVLRLAAEQGTIVVADETMGELGFGTTPVRPPFAVHGPAIMLGSVGKTVWGGLRIGWIRADREIVQRLARSRFMHDLGTPMLEQLILLDLMGQYDRILDERRALLRAGRDHLIRRLREKLPSWDVPTPDGGLTLWVGIGAPVSSQLALAARGHGLLIAAGPRFGLDGVFERFIRIPFGYPPDLLDQGVDALAAAWADVARTPFALGTEDLPQVV